MAAIVGPGGPSTATQFSIDGPGGPVVAGDHLRRDRTKKKLFLGLKFSRKNLFHQNKVFRNKIPVTVPS